MPLSFPSITDHKNLRAYLPRHHNNLLLSRSLFRAGMMLDSSGESSSPHVLAAAAEASNTTTMLSQQDQPPGSPSPWLLAKQEAVAHFPLAAVVVVCTATLVGASAAERQWLYKTTPFSAAATNNNMSLWNQSWTMTTTMTTASNLIVPLLPWMMALAVHAAEDWVLQALRHRRRRRRRRQSQQYLQRYTKTLMEHDQVVVHKLEVVHDVTSSRCDHEDITPTTSWRVPLPGRAEEDERNGTAVSYQRLVSNTCIICLQAYQTGERITWSSNPACTHAFHTECIQAWIAPPRGCRDGNTALHAQSAANNQQQQQERPNCPCCRRLFMVPQH